MPHLENWAIGYAGDVDPYTPPELIKRTLTGTVTGHLRIEDGSFVKTSTLSAVDFEAKTAKTRNTDYTLGAPDPAWIKWCKEHDIDHSKLT